MIRFDALRVMARAHWGVEAEKPFEALLMAYLANGCTICDIPNYVTDIIIGAIIVAAVALDQWRHRRRVWR